MNLRMTLALLLGAALPASALAEATEMVKCVNKTCPSGYVVVGQAGGGNVEEAVGEGENRSTVACLCTPAAAMTDTVEAAQDAPAEGDS